MAVAAIELELGVADTTETAVDDLRLGIVGAGKFGTTLAPPPSPPATTSRSQDRARPTTSP